MRQRKYHTNSTFLDLLFNMLLGITALFFIAFMMINPVDKKNKDIESKAEFIITVTWDSDSPDDVDTYLEDPLGNILYYQAREVGVMHLDRDDLGSRNDEVILRNGKRLYVKDNREVVTIRGIVPGEYVLNVHMYTKYGNNGEESKPTKVKVTVDKINPFSTISSREFFLKKSGDEKTVCRLTLNNEGEVVETNEIPKSLADAANEDGYEDYEDYEHDEHGYEQEYGD